MAPQCPLQTESARTATVAFTYGCGDWKSGEGRGEERMMWMFGKHIVSRDVTRSIAVSDHFTHNSILCLENRQTERHRSPLYTHPRLPADRCSREMLERAAACGFGNWLRTIGLCAFNEFSVVTAEIRIKVGLLVWFCRRSCGCLGFKALVNYNQLCAQYLSLIHI